VTNEIRITRSRAEWYRPFLPRCDRLSSHARTWIARGSCLLACAACRDAPVHAPIAAAKSSVSAAVGDIERADAFELVASSEGAALIWAPSDCAAGVRVQRFDPEGRALADARDLQACGATSGSTNDDAARVIELAAAAGGGQLGVAWLQKRGSETRAFGTHGDDAAQAFSPPLQLGAAEAEESGPGGRSRLWLVAADSGEMRVAWHAPRGPCSAEAGSCAQLISQPLTAGREAANRRTDTREIPVPCARLMVGSIWTAGVWYDAFCALEGSPKIAMTQVYSIRPEIFYAEVVPALPACEPLGVAPSRTGAVVFGQCDDGLAGMLLSPEGQGRRQTLHALTRTVRCEGGRPVLEMQSREGQRETFALSAPRDRLELWLPPRSGLAGQRAVFTGRRLLVAAADNRHLRMHSLYCVGESLVSDPPAVL
jgi:hypothetical protein